MRIFDFLYMFLCLNIGIVFVSGITGGFGGTLFSYEDFIVFSVPTFITSGVIAGFLSWLSGADPIKVAGLSLFTGTVFSCFSLATAVLGSFAVTMDKGSTFPIATTTVGIYSMIQLLLIVIALIQFSVGGFKSNE